MLDTVNMTLIRVCPNWEALWDKVMMYGQGAQLRLFDTFFTEIKRQFRNGRIENTNMGSMINDIAILNGD